MSSLNRISIAIQSPSHLSEYKLDNLNPSLIRFTIVLNRQNLPYLSQLYQTLKPYSQGVLNFMYPFPLSKTIIDTAPTPLEIETAIQGLPPDISISGIPPCLSKKANLKQTSNRWYVDADHQKEKALLFFPNLLRYYKADSCRFCKLNTQCDGFFRQYLSQDILLRPLT